VHLRNLPLTLRKRVSQLRFFIGCLLLRVVEWFELHGRIPARGALFALIVTLVTLFLFTIFPSHPLRFTAALGLGLCAGIIVRSLELVMERT
jgi:hypothetical protein